MLLASLLRPGPTVFQQVPSVAGATSIRSPTPPWSPRPTHGDLEPRPLSAGDQVPRLLQLCTEPDLSTPVHRAAESGFEHPERPRGRNARRRATGSPTGLGHWSPPTFAGRVLPLLRHSQSQEKRWAVTMASASTGVGKEIRSGSGTRVLTLNTTTVHRPSLGILAGRHFWNPVFRGECDHSRSVEMPG